MTSTDRNDLMPAQEDKGQKWVTPKISLMEAEDTYGGGKVTYVAETVFGSLIRVGPS